MAMVENVNLGAYKKPAERPAFNKLAAGAYICQIIKAELDQNEIGIKLKLYVDIAKGEYKDYFKKIYEKRNEWSFNAVFTRYIVKNGELQKSFQDLIKHLETSNPTFEYDENNLTVAQFRDLYCGFIFGAEEYKDSFGAIRSSVKVKFSCTTKAVKDGNIKTPPIKKYVEELPDLENIPEIPDEDVPF